LAVNGYAIHAKYFRTNVDVLGLRLEWITGWPCHCLPGIKNKRRTDCLGDFLSYEYFALSKSSVDSSVVNLEHTKGSGEVESREWLPCRMGESRAALLHAAARSVAKQNETHKRRSLEVWGPT
jgi:hypothetical protein